MGAKMKADEISSIIQERIENFELNVDVEETGKVISIADGVTNVYGLKNVMAGEMVEFEDGEKGMALNLEESSVGVVVLGGGADIKEGTSVKRLGKLLRVPVGDAMIGRVVNPLGEPIDGKGPIETTETRFVEEKALKIAELGYFAFAVDMYGKGVLGQSNEECAGLMQPGMDNR
ncbi:MAG: hypothetical protein L3J44_07560, partial [Campylobacteraceae bacterium]|nr:hypothetical protein [Campylobacteraceae bacterium]